jgi:spermidine/putrescine-binding protein
VGGPQLYNPLFGHYLWKGGNEKNIKPGLDAVEELARLGNIGVVYSSEADAVRAIATGEAAVGILAAANIYELYRQGVPIDAVFIIPGVKTVVVADVIAVVNGPRKDDALKFVDFFALWPNSWGSIFPSPAGAQFPRLLRRSIACCI